MNFDESLLNPNTRLKWGRDFLPSWWHGGTSNAVKSGKITPLMSKLRQKWRKIGKHTWTGREVSEWRFFSTFRSSLEFTRKMDPPSSAQNDSASKWPYFRLLTVVVSHLNLPILTNDIENEGKLRNQAKDSLKYLCTVACDWKLLSPYRTKHSNHQNFKNINNES